MECLKRKQRIHGYKYAVCICSKVQKTLENQQIEYQPPSRIQGNFIVFVFISYLEITDDESTIVKPLQINPVISKDTQKSKADKVSPVVALPEDDEESSENDDYEDDQDNNTFQDIVDSVKTRVTKHEIN